MRSKVIKTKENENTDIQLDPLMKAIKALRSNGGTADPASMESLEKQRRSQERLSKFVTPGVTVSYEKSSIPVSQDYEMPIEWARPGFAHRTDRIILYCHGGGYTCGGLGYAGILAGKLASHTGLEVMTFQYRLAPENPYPAAIEDSVAVWNYLMYMGYGADDVIIAGDSAGGNMALELVLMLQSQKRRLPRAIVLMSPWTDMTVTADSYDRMKDLDPMLTKEYVLGVRAAYAIGMTCLEDGCRISDEEIDYANPSLSPLFAPLKDMPPVYIQVGSNEILQDDSISLYNRLKDNDCRVSLDIYEGGWHVFQQTPTARAYRAMEDIREYIQSVW